ncbi:MAG: hypothetical protein KIT62_02900 [Cyclobacteriaceae bacterium]|nr:hypothetical protein [Cyclobacteriaceae bacterium]
MGKRFGKKIKYQFGIGLYTSILLKQTQYSDLDGSFNFSNDNTKNFRRMDLGLSAGFSAYFPVNDNLSIKVGIDDYFGLLNVSALPVVDGGAIKHNSLGLALGISYIVK